MVSKKRFKELLDSIDELKQDVHCLERKVEYMTEWRLVEHKAEPRRNNDKEENV